MRFVKKSVSVILSAVMVLILGYICVPMSADAYTFGNSETINFNNSTGIAQVSDVGTFTSSNGTLDGTPMNGYGYKADPEDSGNTTFHVFNRTGNSYYFMLGTPNNGYGVENAYTLEPSTTYTLTVRYKYEKGSSAIRYNSDKTGFTNNLQFSVYRSSHVTSNSWIYITNLGKYSLDELPASSVTQMSAQNNFEYNKNKNVPQTYSRKVLNNDTEWLTAQCTFTTEADVTNKDHVILSLVAGDRSICGESSVQTDANQYIGVYFDDITLAIGGEAGEYVYDFVSDGNSCYEDANNNWFSNSETDVYGNGKNASYISDEGMYFTVTNSTRLSSAADWRHRVAIRDTDVNLGGDNGYLKIEAGNKYNVIVKYKPINIEGSFAEIGVGLSAAGGNTYNQMTGSTQHKISVVGYNKHDNISNDWQYVSVEIDGDEASNAGAYAYITASSTNNKPATFLIESVKVCAVADGSNAVVITKNIRGKNFESVVMPVGQELPSAPKSLGETSLGWFLADGTEVTTVPAESATIYAKYSSSVTTFDNGMSDVFLPNTIDLGMVLDVVADPVGDANNKVLAMECTQSSGSTNNFAVSVLGDGFKATAGATYTISFDVYVGSCNMDVSGAQLRLYQANRSGVSHSGGKSNSYKSLSAENQGLMRGTVTSGMWAAISFDYTPSSSDVASYPYILFAYTYKARIDSTKSNCIVYFDNIVITEKDDSSVKVGVVSLNSDVSVEKSTYIVAQGEQVKLPTLTKSGYVFAGWSKSQGYVNGTLGNYSSNLSDDVAPKTVAIADRSSAYYPVWVESTTEYTFGTPSNTTFQNNLTTTPYDSSTSTVSKGFSLYDEDGDGNYELKADQTANDPSAYKVNIGSYDGTNNKYYRLRQGVTYKITMKVKVTALQKGIAHIGVGRCALDNFGITHVTGGRTYANDLFYETTSVTNGYVEISQTYTCDGLFNIANNGTTGSSGMVTNYKDVLFLEVSNGCLYIKDIKIEALSYSPNLTNVTGNGELKVDYANGTITAIPANGYVLKPGSVKVNYKYNFFDTTANGGSYDYNNADHIKVITDARNYVQNVFNYRGAAYGNETYSFTNIKGTSPDSMVISAEFIPDSQIAVGTVANSIRLEKNGANYVSAGLRFRGRVRNDNRISEVGFIIVPTQLVYSLDTLTFKSDGKINCANAVKVVVFDGNTNTAYDKFDDYTDYQVIIKDLTNKEGSVDMTGVQFSVVTYAKYNNNGVSEYAYSEVKSESWDSVYVKYQNR